MKKQDAWRVAALCLSVAAVSSYITWRVVTANQAAAPAPHGVPAPLAAQPAGEPTTKVEPELLMTKSGRIIPEDKPAPAPAPKEPEVFRGTKSAPMINPK